MDASKTFHKTGNQLTGFTDPGAKQQMTDEEILSAMNVPERDEGKYPEQPEDVQVEAGTFLSRLSLVAATYDGNLRSLMWGFYGDLTKFLTTRETVAEDVVDMFASLDAMKKYIFESKNPLLVPEGSSSGETPSGEESSGVA